MFNSQELKAEMVRQSVSQADLAQEIGLNLSTFNRKLNEKSAVFTVREAQRIADVLNLSPEQSTAIFFANELA